MLDREGAFQGQKACQATSAELLAGLQERWRRPLTSVADGLVAIVSGQGGEELIEDHQQ